MQSLPLFLKSIEKTLALLVDSLALILLSSILKKRKILTTVHQTGNSVKEELKSDCFWATHFLPSNMSQFVIPFSAEITEYSSREKQSESYLLNLH